MDAVGALRLVYAVTVRAQEDQPADGPELSATQVLSALVLLRQLREELAGWEPALIAAARRLGVSWAQLAPALGVASRQAAERRYLRLRPSESGKATGDQRVQAERDRRAVDRAVTRWARQNSALLRQLAGQVSALDGLGEPAQQQVDLVHEALANDDAAALLPTLTDAQSHLQSTHPGLAEQITVVTEHTEQLRRDTQGRRADRQLK